mgnify:CR=1 FL=1
MNILLCMKQVPDTTEIKIDPETNTLIRAGVPSIVNTFDAYALEVAARMKDADPEGTKVTVISMGPDQAKEALKGCLAVGADEAYLVSDRVFGGSDTLATSYILSCAIQKLEADNGVFDVIFCGKQAIDGDTAQVGPEIAEHLDRPQITYASNVEVENGELRIKRESDLGYDIMTCKTPCVITVVKTPFEPRYPTMKTRMAATRAQIPVITSADLNGIDTTRCGLKGSPTKVKKTFTPERNKTCRFIQEDVSKDSARVLLGLLVDAKLF